MQLSPPATLHAHTHTHTYTHMHASHVYTQTQYYVLQNKYSDFLCMCFVCVGKDIG